LYRRLYAIISRDASFKKKAEACLEEFIEQSSIMTLASYSNETIQRLCNKVVLLEKGKLKYFGPIEEGFQKYVLSNN
jgi:ABC-type polysaccharide/polyol phosphate transport system ATPase subunit